MSFASLMNTTLTIRRKTYAKDAIGGRSGTELIVSGQPGRVRNMSGKELDFLSKNANEIMVRIYTGIDTEILNGDFVTDETTKIEYEVVRVNPPNGHHYELAGKEHG